MEEGDSGDGGGQAEGRLEGAGGEGAEVLDGEEEVDCFSGAGDAVSVGGGWVVNNGSEGGDLGADGGDQGGCGVESATGAGFVGQGGQRIDGGEQHGLDLGEGESGVGGLEEGGGAGDLGGGHGGAAHDFIVSAEAGGEDLMAAGSEVNGLGTEVGEPDERIGVVGSGDGDEVGRGETGGVVGVEIVVNA